MMSWLMASPGRRPSPGACNRDRGRPESDGVPPVRGDDDDQGELDQLVVEMIQTPAEDDSFAQARRKAHPAFTSGK